MQMFLHRNMFGIPLYVSTSSSPPADDKIGKGLQTKTIKNKTIWEATDIAILQICTENTTDDSKK